MALDTRDVVVFGSLPCLNIRFHDVTGITQQRTRAEAIEPAEREASNDNAGSRGKQKDTQTATSDDRLFNHLMHSLRDGLTGSHSPTTFKRPPSSHLPSGPF